MNMKRVLIFALMLMITAVFTVTAGGQKEEGAAAPGERDVIEYDTISILWSDIVPEHPSLYDEEMLKRFSIKFNIEYLSRAAYNEKISVLLATGEGIDVVFSGGPGRSDIMPWAAEGHLVPISDYLDKKIPNYRKLFTDKEWDFMYDFAKSPDGKLYWLPDKRSYKPPFLVDIWREGTLKKMGLSVPKTTDEFYGTMKKVLEKQPDAVVRTVWGAFPDFFCGPFRTNTGWYLDPDSEKLEFGPTTAKFRDALIFSAKMYSAGLTDQEWTPAGKDHYFEAIYKGRTYYTHSYADAAANSNEQMESVDPDAGWTWTAEYISHYPGKTGTSFVADLPVNPGGPFITKQCAEEKMERFFEYLNWSATEEGSLFNAMGVEGKTFEYKAGKPVFMDHIKTFDNPDGDRDIVTYGFGVRLLIEPMETLIRRKGTKYVDLVESVNSQVKPGSVLPYILWNITEEQAKDLADIETVLTDVWKEWTIKFITGILDPSEDAPWNAFQAELKKVGFDKARAIREEAFKVSGLWRG